MWAIIVVMMSIAMCAEALDGYPDKLSGWQLFTVHEVGKVPQESNIVYALKEPLFSDYAHKLRTVKIPKSQPITVQESRVVFPVGTLLSKTFFYPEKKSHAVECNDGWRKQYTALAATSYPLETRLLYRHSSGRWDALIYKWDTDGKDATRIIAGDSISITLVDADHHTEKFMYRIPMANQCVECHGGFNSKNDIEPLGWQLWQHDAVELQRLGLKEAAMAPEAVVHTPVREYLDVNCAHCHSAHGTAAASGLLLTVDTPECSKQLGLFKRPSSAGDGSLGLKYDIVPSNPDSSILLGRMKSMLPDIRMPELGRHVTDREGVALVARWILEMPEICNAHISRY